MDHILVSVSLRNVKAAPLLYFLISYHQLYKHGGLANLGIGRYTSFV
jgi:hypothetical protein